MKQAPSKPETDHHSIGFRICRGFPKSMVGMHLHTDLEWNFILSGSMRYFLGGRFHTIPCSRLAVFWGGAPHRLIETEKGTQCIWVTIPLGWALQWELPEHFLHRLLCGEILLESEKEIDSQFNIPVLERWVDDFQSADPIRRRIVLLEVEARLQRLALNYKCPIGNTPTKVTGGGQVERITNYIGQNYTREMSVKEIAETVRLHPSYMMKLFRKSCGMSIWEYVLRLRTSHAQRLLFTSKRKILDVALDSGFGSATRFYAIFLRLCGCTPRAYRQGIKRKF